MCRAAPSIHHFFFADDSFLFTQVTVSECLSIKQVLRKYELASGQAVNFKKSCVSFSPDLNSFDKQLLADCLGIRRVEFHDKYLGLPVLFQKSKKETFAYVKARVWKKLQSWTRVF